MLLFLTNNECCPKRQQPHEKYQKQYVGGRTPAHILVEKQEKVRIGI